MTELKKVPFSFKKLRHWLFDLINGYMRKRTRYVFLSLPFCNRQTVINRNTGTKKHFYIRDYVDLAVGHQIYKHEFYRLDCLARYDDIMSFYRSVVASGKTPVIVDCGANIGVSSNYFAEIFPEAKVYAVEPEPGNFDMIKMNCADRNVVPVHGAIGSECKKCDVIDTGKGGWAFRVEETEAGKLPVYDIPSVLNSGNPDCEVPFIVKIDIEGFEKDLFSKNTEWADRFPLMIIELHDWMYPKMQTSQNFIKTVACRNRDFVYIGESVFSISNGI